MSTQEIVYFVHISDTHIGPTADYARFGHAAYPCARRLVEIINHMPITPDFVIHTGDVVTNPDPASYALAAELFSRLDVPIYYVTGNHDTSYDVRRHMAMGPKQDVTDDPTQLSYTFEVKGYRFLVLDGRGPDDIDPHGMLTDEQLALVRREAQPEGPPLILFLHFPALPLNSIWFDDNALLLNGEEFHQTLLPARERLRGVFYGHVHQNTQTMRDGILYVSMASTFAQLVSWPGDDDPVRDADHPPAYGVVHLLPQQTIVRQHMFPRP